MTGHPSVESAPGARRRGARGYNTKPLAFEEEVRPLVEEVLGSVSRALDEFDGVAAADGPMAGLLALLPRIGASDAPALVRGESGTGKELVARAIHQLSPRREAPFVAINCAALNEGVLEAELFGAARGAYTGASHDRAGVFDAAAGGTLLLDEIAESSPALQAKLLRVIQEGEFHRVGDPRHGIRTDVRVIAATHRDLEAEVREGRFRLDLFYRLQVLLLEVPPLRERLDELPELVAHHARRCGVGALEIDPEAALAMRRHDWPGNLRELRNVVERAVVLGNGRRLRLEDLPAAFHSSPDRPADPGDHDALVTLRQAEEQQIREAMRRTTYNRSQAARLLGVTRRTLGYRIRKYGLEDELRAAASALQPTLPGVAAPASAAPVVREVQREHGPAPEPS